MDGIQVGDQFILKRDNPDRVFTVLAFMPSGVLLQDTHTKRDGEPFRHTVSFSFIGRDMFKLPSNVLPYSHRS